MQDLKQQHQILSVVSCRSYVVFVPYQTYDRAKVCLYLVHYFTTEGVRLISPYTYRYLHYTYFTGYSTAEHDVTRNCVWY